MPTIKVRTRVIEVEAGWLLVKFEGPKPPAETRPRWLRRTLKDWRSKHGGRRIAHVKPVKHEGQVIGLMAWTHLPAPKPIRVHRDVKFPKEHLEAFIQHALQYYFRETSGDDPVAVVNRSGVAVLFGKERISVCPIEKTLLSEKIKADFAKWRKSDKSIYFCVRPRPAPDKGNGPGGNK